MALRDKGQTPPGEAPFLERIEIPPEWEAAGAAFLAQGGVAMVLGAPDTGKSTLSRYLVQRAHALGLKVALVDLDLGQSHLGPPATLGLGVFPPRRPGDDSLVPEGLYFIGRTSPVGAVPEVAVGCRILADMAARRGARRLVVNTSGFVQGPGAVQLKRWETELLRSSLILALERRGELTPLLRGLGLDELSNGCRRLPVSERVNSRSAEERRQYREKRFRRYFQGARRLDLPWRSLVWEGLFLGQGRDLDRPTLKDYGRELDAEVLHGEARGRRIFLLLQEAPPEAKRPPLYSRLHWLAWPDLQHLLVGLLDRGRRTLALGLILPQAWHPERLALLTPLAAGAEGRVHFVKAGKVRLTPEGREMPYV